MFRKGLLLICIILLINFSFAIGDSTNTDGDEFPDYKDPFPNDFDNDGLPDDYELKYDLDKMKSNEGLDTDQDGLDDLDEYELGTNPTSLDTDSDGLNDNKEIKEGTNPLSKWSPFNLNEIIKILIPSLIIILFILIIFYVIFNNKTSKRKNNKKEQKETVHFMNNINKLFDILLGPSIKKAKEKERIKSETKINEEKKKKEKEKEKINFDKLIKTDIKDDEIIKPENFLVRILNRNKKHNNFHEILAYFDKVIGKEELTFFKERKSKKEIIEWLKNKKEMKKKLIEILNEQKHIREQINNQTIQTNHLIKKKEDSIFDKLDKISDDVYEEKLK